MNFSIEDVRVDMAKKGLVYLGLVAYNPVTDGLTMYFSDEVESERATAILARLGLEPNLKGKS